MSPRRKPLADGDMPHQAQRAVCLNSVTLHAERKV